MITDVDKVTMRGLGTFMTSTFTFWELMLIIWNFATQKTLQEKIRTHLMAFALFVHSFKATRGVRHTHYTAKLILTLKRNDLPTICL